MQTQTYDYPASKEANAKLSAAIEAFEAEVKQNKEAVDELVQENTAPGVQSTMNATKEKLDAQIKVIAEAREIADGILANAKAYAEANGEQVD